mgnify:CR=1 FL=1
MSHTADGMDMEATLLRAGLPFVLFPTERKGLPPEEITAFVNRLAHRIASFPAEAIALAKEAVATGLTVRQLLEKKKLLPPEELAEVLDLRAAEVAEHVAPLLVHHLGSGHDVVDEVAVQPFPALAGILPTGVPEDALDVAFDVLRQPQLEQVGHPALPVGEEDRHLRHRVARLVGAAARLAPLVCIKG